MLPDNVLLSEKDVNFAPPNKMKPRERQQKFDRDLALPHSSSLLHNSKRVGRHTQAVCRPHFVEGQFDSPSEDRQDCPCSDPRCPRNANWSEIDVGGYHGRNGRNRSNRNRNGGYSSTYHDRMSNYSFIIGGNATEQNAEVEEAEYVGFKDQSYGCGKIGGYRKED